jgi:hypothetical protein
MADERLKAQWMHTSALMALMANLQRDPKKSRPLKPADFNPYAKRKSESRQQADVSILKKIFVPESVK